MADYLLAFDQGSTNSKAVLLNRKGSIVREAAVPLRSDRPGPGRVEHDPYAILKSQIAAAEGVLGSLKRGRDRVAALGIANQRSTIILWDKASGRPLAPAISWQDLRAAERVRRWADRGEEIRSKTGLRLTPYYAAPKLRWLLDHVKGARRRADRGELLCGTVNTYLIWHLTRGEVHATDHTNAARMLLMNLKGLCWDEDLLALFGIPPSLLPRLLPTQSDFGTARLGGRTIPIRASLGDQQAGLLGIGAVRKGEAVLNFGTGGFLLVNTGSDRVSIPGLLTSLAWSTPTEWSYVVEGTVNAVGTVFEWLQRFGLIRSPKEIDRAVKASRERVVLVPALAGLGAPHWLNGARTAIFGLGPHTAAADLVRAALEGVAFLVRDIVEEVRSDGRIRIRRLSAAGGASRVDSLVRIQSEVLGMSIRRSKAVEAGALGAGRMAGVACRWWRAPSALPKSEDGRVFRPGRSKDRLAKAYEEWKRAIDAVRGFEEL